MKIVLVVLIFACFFHVISAFLWFNSYANEPIKALTTSSTSRRPTSPLQQSANQQKNQLPYRTFIFRRIPVTTRTINSGQNPVRNSSVVRQGNNVKASPIIIRDRFHAILYRTQQRQIPLLNNSFPIQRPANQTANNPPKQVIYARFPPAVPPRKVNTVVITMPNRQPVALGKVTTPNPKANLLRILTTTAARINAFENRQRLFDQYNRDEHWRAVYQQWNQRTTVRTPFKINSALRRRKRQNEHPSMILARHETFTEEQ